MTTIPNLASLRLGEAYPNPRVFGLGKFLDAPKPSSRYYFAPFAFFAAILFPGERSRYDNYLGSEMKVWRSR